MSSRPVIYPLEGTGLVEEVRFFLYDQLGRKDTGAELRVRREKNPDTLTLELRPSRNADWKPFIMLTTIDGQIGVATFGIQGGGINGVRAG